MSGWAGGALVPHPPPPPCTHLFGANLDDDKDTFQRHGPESPNSGAQIRVSKTCPIFVLDFPTGNQTNHSPTDMGIL